MNPQTVFSEIKRAWSALWKGRVARSSVLDDLIRGVEESSGCARTDARAKAKTWLINHVASMNQRDIEVARSHFGYLLPAQWGVAS